MFVVVVNIVMDARSLSEVHCYVLRMLFYLFIFYDRRMLRPRLTEVRETFTRGGP